MKTDHWSAMTYRGPADDALRDTWRGARRMALLQYHPERGGDALRLKHELEHIDLRFIRAEMAGPDADTAPVDGDRAGGQPRGWRPATRLLRRAGRALLGPR